MVDDSELDEYSGTTEVVDVSSLANSELVVGDMDTVKELLILVSPSDEVDSELVLVGSPDGSD